MKTQKILDNFHHLPVLDVNTDGINDVLLAMYKEPLRVNYDEDLISLLPDLHFEARRVYQAYVDCSNSCDLQLLLLNGEPLTFYGHHGHEDTAHMEATVVNREAALTLAKRLAEGLAQRRLDEYQKELTPLPEKLFELGASGYLTSLSDSVFGLCPELELDQHYLMKAPFQVWLNRDSHMVKVTGFQTRDTDNGPMMFAQTDEGVFEAPNGRVVFQFLDATDELICAKRHMREQGSWFIHRNQTDAKARSAMLYEREPHSWYFRMHLIMLDNEAEYQAFIAQHPLDKEVAGEFPYDTIPDSATVY